MPIQLPFSQVWQRWFVVLNLLLPVCSSCGTPACFSGFSLWISFLHVFKHYKITKNPYHYDTIVRPRCVRSTCKQSQVKAKSAVHKMHFLTGWKTYSDHRYNIKIQHTFNYCLTMSTAVGQAAACAPVMQRARVRSLVGTGFLGEVFSGFFLTCKTNVGKL